MYTFSPFVTSSSISVNFSHLEKRDSKAFNGANFTLLFIPFILLLGYCLKDPNNMHIVGNF
jgi:hypothetical protein